MAHIARSIRDAGLATPVVVSGGIATFDQAEAILQRGEADVIGSARQSLADPDWYANVLPASDIAEIDSTSRADIIERNTNADLATDTAMIVA